jgi:N-acyl homoserine lactone hydrolase
MFRTALKNLALSTTVFLAGCHASSHPTTAADLGAQRPVAEMFAALNEPGPIRVETVVSAHWEVDREGLINLDHPKAKSAGLESGPEPIHIAFHALHHPTKGLFVVDTGVERTYRDAPDDVRLSWFVKQVMDGDALDVKIPLGDYLERQSSRLRGVFLTHLHLDHVMGLPDVGNEVPVYVGPGEASDSNWSYLFTRSSIDGHLEGKHALRELSIAEEPGAPLRGVVDVFGDASLWAISVPGHTQGSIAYLARTPDGPVLMTGDACHTRWGWENEVEPGTFSVDTERSVESLAQLHDLVRRYPNIQVRLGHQH